MQKRDRWGIERCWFGIWGVTPWLEQIVGFLAGSLQHSTSRGVRCASTVLAFRVLAGVTPGWARKGEGLKDPFLLMVPKNRSVTSCCAPTAKWLFSPGSVLAAQ